MNVQANRTKKITRWPR